MHSPDLLLTMIRAEYRELPGLRLTFAQACRLWNLTSAECEAAIETLLAEKFLRLTLDGTFAASGALDGLPRSPRKAVLRRKAPAARPNRVA
jgi:hypothetical protein